MPVRWLQEVELLLVFEGDVRIFNGRLHPSDHETNVVVHACPDCIYMLRFAAQPRHVQTSPRFKFEVFRAFTHSQ